MSEPTIHYHVVIDFDGVVDITHHPSFTSAMEKARTELTVERLLDKGLVRRLRRKFVRREYIARVYAEWIGSNVDPSASPDIHIEVSVCTPGLHA
jgi:hypothetical protein